MSGGDCGQDVPTSAPQAHAPDALPPLAVDQTPAEHSAKARPKESQQLRPMTIVEAGRFSLTEQEQSIRKWRLGLEQDQGFRADIANRRTEQPVVNAQTRRIIVL